MRELLLQVHRSWGRSLAINAAPRQLRQFARHDGGVTIVGFAVIFMFVVLCTGILIDYGRAEGERTRMQAAVDAAALAASDLLGLPNAQTEGPKRARAYFEANVGKNIASKIDSVVLDPDTGEVKVKTSGTMFSSLLSIVGIQSMEIGAATTVAKGNGNVEIALVLDNSGSMSGTPIDDLRTAARNLVSVIFTGNEGTERVSVGVVPFAGAVNVGTTHRYSAWMDTEGVSPFHRENIAGNKKRFTLFSDMGESWAGCVEARSAPNDVSDAIASSGEPATLFNPLFAPDEPDVNNGAGASYYNNYLDDAGGSCPPLQRTCTRYSWRGNCVRWQTETLGPSVAQKRTCKYDGGNADTRLAYGTRKGPNMLCDSTKILPLMTEKSIIENAIDAMSARGGTNIPEGIMWGWRVLSPAAPFSEGRSYGDSDNKKFMVVMSDGANWHGALSNHNKSWYSAFGYAANGRLGSGNMSSSDLKAAMNAKTADACDNAKAAGITIYTVAFNLSDSTTLNLLRNCASDSEKALTASGGGALASTFEEIARDISKLRISG